MLSIDFDIVEGTIKVLMYDKHYMEDNLVLNWDKCLFVVKEGIVLCHKILGQRIHVDQAKVEVI